jgi:hypothetical protein
MHFFPCVFSWVPGTLFFRSVENLLPDTLPGLHPAAVAPSRDNAALPGSGFSGITEESYEPRPNGGRDDIREASNLKKKSSTEPIFLIFTS